MTLGYYAVLLSFFVCLFRCIPTCLENAYLGHQGGKKSKLTQHVVVSILYLWSFIHNYFSGLGLFTSFFIIFSRVTQQTELPKSGDPYLPVCSKKNH